MNPIVDKLIKAIPSALIISDSSYYDNCITINEALSTDNKYRNIIAIESLDHGSDQVEQLKSLSKMLYRNGHLYVAFRPWTSANGARLNNSKPHQHLIAEWESKDNYRAGLPVKTLTPLATYESWIESANLKIVDRTIDSKLVEDHISILAHTHTWNKKRPIEEVKKILATQYAVYHLQAIIEPIDEPINEPKNQSPVKIVDELFYRLVNREANDAINSGSINSFDNHWLSVGKYNLCPRKINDSVKLNGKKRGCLMTPTLMNGGAERWCHDLICNTNTEIDWKVLITAHSKYDNQLFYNIAARSQVVIVNNNGVPKHNFSVAAELPINDAIKVATNDVDFIVSWGHSDLTPWINEVKCPVIATAHGSLPSTGMCIANAMRRATHCVAVSDGVANICPSGTKVIKNGLNIQRCASILSKEQARGRFRLDDDKIVVGYCGRLSSEKNIQQLIKSVSNLSSKFTLLIVGEGEEKAKLKNLASNLMVDCRFTGLIDDIGNYLKAIDISATTTFSEGCSYSLLEAMAAGVPIVSTTTGSIPEMEKEAGCDLFYKLNADATCYEVANMINKASNSDSTMVAIAQRLVLDNYTVDKMAKEWIDYLFSL